MKSRTPTHESPPTRAGEPDLDTRRGFLHRTALTLGSLGALAALQGAQPTTATAQQADRRGGGSSATSQPPPRKKVAIHVFEGVQIIDFAGPYEVFGQAGYEVFTVGAKATPLTTVMGLSITPRYSYADAPRVDLLVVPGGSIHPALHDASVIKWIGETSRQTAHTMSVCNGAFFLGEAGLLKGLTVTANINGLEDLASRLPDTRVVSDKRFVDNGRIVTTAGLSSGIDGALHMVSKLSGRGVAQLAALGMEYDWKEDSTYARASLADYHIRRVFAERPKLGLTDQENVKIQSTRGDRMHWETRAIVQTNRSPTAIADAIGGAIDSRGTWRAVGDSAGKLARRWTFSDDNGAPWAALLETYTTGSPDVNVRLAVERA